MNKRNKPTEGQYVTVTIKGRVLDVDSDGFTIQTDYDATYCDLDDAAVSWKTASVPEPILGSIVQDKFGAVWVRGESGWGVGLTEDINWTSIPKPVVVVRAGV